MALFEYLKQTQRFLREANQQFINPEDLISYINRARREVAMRAQCVRRLPPITGAVITATVTDGGTGYSASPTLTITTPDFPSGTGPFPSGAQATAEATVQNGIIIGISITYGGAGYFQPTIEITDSTGVDATATLEVSAINALTAGQEVYAFRDVDLSPFPGIESVYTVRSVSIIYSNYRYSLPCYDFSTYQALIRQYSLQYQYVPCVVAQFGQGDDGTLYMYPLPSQTWQMEWDCLCLPSDLTDDLSVDVVPAPWKEAVPYFAAHLGYLELQNFNAAKGYLDLFDKFVQRYSDYARPGRRINPYGRP